MRKNFFILFIATLVFSTAANARIFCVSITGSDANVLGDFAHPWFHIQKALDSCKPGDRVVVRGGVYYERLVWSKSGKIDSIISLEAYNPYVDYSHRVVSGINQKPIPDQTEQVYIDGGPGSSSSELPPMIKILNKSYLLINHVNIRNNYSSDAYGIHISGEGTGVTVKNCRIYRIGFTASYNNWTVYPGGNDNAHAIKILGDHAANYNNILISNNEIDSCNTGWSEALAVSGNVDGFTIEKNKIHDITNIGIDLAGFYETIPGGGDSQARNGMVLNNTVYNCISPIATSAGIYVDGGKQITIQGNKVYGCGYGIEVGTEMENKLIQYVRVRNNFVYNNLDAGIVMGSTENGSSVRNSCITGNTLYKNYTQGTDDDERTELTFNRANTDTIRNNIVFARAKRILVGISSYNYTGMKFKYNLYYSATGTTSNIVFDGLSGVFTGLAAWKASTQAYDSNTTYNNPQLVSTTDFHLSSSSPAINAGDPAYVVQPGELDIDLQARIKQVGTIRIDIGADERYEVGERTTGTSSSLQLASRLNADNSETSINVYPNPASHYVSIVTPTDNVERTVFIYSEKGQQVYSRKITNAKTNIDLDKLQHSAGVLTIKVVSDTETNVRRIVIL